MKRTIAKITAPKTQGVFRRERLFRLLDNARSRPVVWVTAPPGSGKTTLLAGYLSDRKLPNIWYQVDEGDSDPSAFFYYMRLAIKGYRRGGRETLPLLTPEYLPAVAAFTRRYFEELCRSMPHPFVIVFDNCHAVPEGSLFYDMLLNGSDSLTEGANVIVMSRTGLPEHFTRLRANRLPISYR